MIQSRRSNEILNKDTILSKVSEYQIFKYFCSNFEDTGKRFRSDLREDNSPTVHIISGTTGYYTRTGVVQSTALIALHMFNTNTIQISMEHFYSSIALLASLFLLLYVLGGLYVSGPKRSTSTSAVKIAVRIRRWNYQDKVLGTVWYN